ncbi:MAG: cysteine--tRNA ligase [Deltaproteobacteria bacterium]|nr:cysteine--tRNA ligase [Deltaproteobacteria bacterium]
MKIHNTLTRREEEFKPIKAKHVGMYVCGITAYDSCHIGHARAAVAFDVVVRYLRYKGFKVKFVRNYTDIDDKIISRAGKEKRDWKELAEYYIKEYAEDMAGLKNLKPDIEPRATDHIKEMIETIQKLFDRGFAYQTKSGVYFSVRKFKDYGRLSGKNIEDLESGARIAVDEDKNDPLDFALWKASKPDEPKWPSPWGEGRPGWHIECSAMSSKYLGQPFDIHGGGQDLIFPHHENEMAQAEGACGCQFVKYWLHNGFINIDAEKMSKSLGNIKTIRETLKQYDFETLRYFLISSHYRSPLDYTAQALADASAAVDRFYEMTVRLSPSPFPLPSRKRVNAEGATEKQLQKALESLEDRITAFMDDDFNTAGAMGVIFDAVRQTNKYLDSSCHSCESRNPVQLNALDPRFRGDNNEFFGWLSSQWHEIQKTLDNIFGMFNSAPAEYQSRRKKMATSTKGVDTSLVEQLISDRAAARKSKDFAKADAVKKQLADMGVELKDKPDGTTEWKIK